MNSINLEEIIVKNADKGTSFNLDELLREISDIEAKCREIPVSNLLKEISPLHQKSKTHDLNKKEKEVYNSLLNQIKNYYSIKNETKNRFEKGDLIEVDLQQQQEIIEYRELTNILFSRFEDFYLNVNPFLDNENLLYINTHSNIEEEQREYCEKLYNFLFIVSPQGFPNGDLSCNKKYYEEVRKVDIAREFLVGDKNSIDEYLNPNRYNHSSHFFENVDYIKKNIERIKSLD